MDFIKTLLIITGITLFIWFAAPLSIFGILNTGNLLGMFFSAMLTIYGIFSKPINKFVVLCFQNKFGKIFIFLVAVFTIIVVLFIIFTTAKMIWTANNAPKKETTVVVLGCQVKTYGPSLMLKERLDATYSYLTENKNLSCVLSGGQGPDEPISEAQCMYDWLVEKGIDKDRLYLEDKSTSTRENLIFSKQVIDKNGLNPAITIITNEFHQYRAGEIAEALGIEAYHVSAKTLITLLATYYVRELGGILFEIFIPIK